MNDFLNRIVLITGGGSGIGQATALEFSKRGAITIVADLNLESAMNTCNLIEGKGPTPFPVQCDVSKEGDVKRLFNLIFEKFKRLDHAYNNAGIEGHPFKTSDTPTEQWDQVIQTNLKGVWLCMKYEIKSMLLQKEGGTIVNCSSVAGLFGFEGSSAYTASKHAVIGLGKSASLEYAKSGIRINTICPGIIETPMVQRYFKEEPAARESLIAQIPMGRVGLPSEIAKAVAWLSSPDASYLHGHSMIVDGGWTVGL